MDSTPPSSLPPLSDLSNTIAHLKSLLSFASSTLFSLPFSSPPIQSSPLLPCPYNPHHSIPPEFLYNHFLNCPSVLPLPTLPSIPPLDPEQENQQNQIDFSTNFDSDSDFVFSLEENLRDIASGFFYNDCPGVVSSLPEPAKSFVLPNFLLSECGNLKTIENGRTIDKSMKILPSEYQVLRKEAESWQSFPAQYSYTTLRAILGLNSVSKGDLKKCLLTNSPKYGIIIDVIMSEYIHLLLNLCLKAITRETYNSLEVLLRKNEILDPKSLGFQCPNLVKSLTWLTTQLSILYGEVNAVHFSLSMIKEVIMKSGYCIMINNFEGKNGETNTNKKMSEMDKEDSRSACGGNVFVSQIAGAIGALYRRAFLEGKIRALRSTQPISKPHLLMEYAYLTSRAAEERSKRPNYRPILDYDSLSSNRAYDQGNNGRAKTREEMLAEERDYKRRRISYRGKKVKRSPTEVLRDIIEDHMEQIIQTNSNQLSSDANKIQNPNSSDIYESSCHDDSIYRKSERERDDYSHHSSRSSKGNGDRNGGKDRDRDKIDRYRTKERRDKNDNDDYKRNEMRKDHESRRSESMTFNDRYDPTGRNEKRR